MENPFQLRHFPFLPLLNPPIRMVLVDGSLLIKFQLSSFGRF